MGDRFYEYKKATTSNTVLLSYGSGFIEFLTVHGVRTKELIYKFISESIDYIALTPPVDISYHYVLEMVSDIFNCVLENDDSRIILNFFNMLRIKLLIYDAYKIISIDISFNTFTIRYISDYKIE